MLNDTFPLRVESIPAAHASEWRADDSFPPSETQAWQLVFVRSGTIEERCDARHVLLRAGGLLFHQPGARSRPRRCASTFTAPARPWTVSAVRCCTRSLPSSMT